MTGKTYDNLGIKGYFHTLNSCWLIVVLFLANTITSAPIWPNWKFDRQLTGRCPYVGPLAFDLKWSYSTGDTFQMRNAQPIIAENGTIYFSSPDSFIFAVSSSGSLKWKYKTGGIPNFPALDNRGRIYVCVNNYEVLALDDSATYAKRVWTWGPANIPNSSSSVIIVGADRTTYVTIDSMYAIDSTGTKKWGTSRGESGAYPPAISRDGQYLYYEYAEAMSVYFRKMNINGSLVWSRAVGGAPGSLTWGSPAIGNDSSIYMAWADGRITALRPNNTDKWTPISGLGTNMNMTVTLGRNDTLWFMTRLRRPKYFKFSPDNGSEILEDSVIDVPAHYNYFDSFITDALGQAYIVLRDSTGGSHSATLYALNPDGTIKSTCPLPSGAFRSFPALGPDSTLYVINGVNLYSFKQNAATTEEYFASNTSQGKELVITPNPGRIPGAIAIRLPARTTIQSLKIYNAAGQIVRCLTVNPGTTSTVLWDGFDLHGHTLEAGIYFCQVQGTDRYLSGKIVLMK